VAMAGQWIGKQTIIPEMTFFYKTPFEKLQPFLNAAAQLEKFMDICGVIKKESVPRNINRKIKEKQK